MSKARLAAARALAQVLARALALALAATVAAPTAGAQGAAQDGPERTSLAGSAYYSLGANDYSGSGPLEWPLSQSAGISAGLSGGSALRVEAAVGFDPAGDGLLDAQVDRLSLSFSPAFGVSVSAGLGRLKWGTARRF
jgi:hypothetical protein